MRQEVGDLRRALDLAPTPVAVLDGSGRLVCASERAERMLVSDHGLRLEHGRLTTLRPASAASISAALVGVVKLADGPRRGQSGETPPAPPVVEVLREARPALRLIFLPLRPSSGIRKGAAGTARVLVVFHDPEDTVRLDPQLLARLHRLTPAEALLASALAEGLTPQEFAASRGTSEATVRTQLKRLLEKTGTHRQPDLVRVLLTSVSFRLGPGRD
jgi:DNA-binding CsgD family transcriptional regulator